jgi:hypothetical protein
MGRALFHCGGDWRSIWRRAVLENFHPPSFLRIHAQEPQDQGVFQSVCSNIPLFKNKESRTRGHEVTFLRSQWLHSIVGKPKSHFIQGSIMLKAFPRYALINTLPKPSLFQKKKWSLRELVIFFPPKSIQLVMDSSCSQVSGTLLWHQEKCPACWVCSWWARCPSMYQASLVPICPKCSYSIPLCPHPRRGFLPVHYWVKYILAASGTRCTEKIETKG